MSLDEMAAQIATPDYVQAKALACEHSISTGELTVWIALGVLAMCVIACTVAYVLDKKTRFDPEAVYAVCALVAIIGVFALFVGISLAIGGSRDRIWWQSDPVTKVVKMLADAL